MAEPIDISPAVVVSLLLGACPEKAAELADFWASFKPRFALKRDAAGLAISALGNRVSWMHKTFAHDWVVAFAGYKALAAYGPHVFGSEISVQALSDDDGLSVAEAQLDTMLYFARQIRMVDTLEELEWLPEVPRPDTKREALTSAEDQVCFDIACVSAAATFLHELRHVQYAVEGNAPTASVDEERACDDFSRTILLEKVDAYASHTGEDADQVASKRVIGLASAALAIAEAEPQGMASAIQATHPPLRERFTHLVLKAEVTENATCWYYTGCLLIALLRRDAKLQGDIHFTSAKDLCRQLVAAL